MGVDPSYTTVATVVSGVAHPTAPDFRWATTRRPSEVRHGGPLRGLAAVTNSEAVGSWPVRKLLFEILEEDLFYSPARPATPQKHPQNRPNYEGVNILQSRLFPIFARKCFTRIFLCYSVSSY